MAKPIMTLTPRAAEHARYLIAKAEGKIAGLRIGIKHTGCSGLSYVMEYAQAPKKFEDVIEEQGVKLFIDPTAVMFLLGSEMDYETGKFESKFTFKNPNEIDRCGCGESFRVKPDITAQASPPVSPAPSS